MRIVYGGALAVTVSMFALGVRAQQPSAPASLFISASQIEATLTDSVARNVIDQPMHGSSAVPILGGRASVAMLRRVKPETSGLIHDHVTEIYRIVEGRGVLVTGGALTDAKPTDLTRVNAGMSRIGTHQGGSSQQVGPRDIVIVPAGTAHRFSELAGTIVYEVYRFEPSPGTK